MKKILPLSQLFSKSFQIYKANFWTFVRLISFNVALFLCAFIMGALFSFTLFFFNATPKNILFSGIVAIVFGLLLVALIIAVMLVKVSLFFVIKEKNPALKINEYLNLSWQVLSSYVWVYFLVNLCVAGGMILLVIPGILFAVWLSFAGYIVIFEGKKGVEALKASRELVRGNWWPVFGRYLLLGVLAAIAGSIPFIGWLINIVFILPFTVIYGFVIYEDLKG